MGPHSNQHLLDLARRLQRVTTVDALVDVATEAMRSNTRYRDAWITLLDPDKQTAFALGGTGAGGADSVEAAALKAFSIADDAMVQEVIASKEPVIIFDAPLDPRPNPIHVEALGSRTIVNIPLLLDEATIGCFGFGTFGETGPLPPTDDEMEFFNAMASHLSVVIARLRAEERRRDVEAQLLRSQRLEAMGHLAGGVAHDFNNLLTAVLGNVELARDELSDGDPMLSYLDDINEAATRAATLSRQLLAFARRQVIESQPLDLNHVVAGMQTIVGRLLPESITIEYLPGSDLGTVMADPGQVEQVIMNLALNARDAMPGGGRLVIETEDVVVDEAFISSHPWARPGRFVLLSVTDSGEGIPADVLDKIFEPFFTTKGPDRGTGLGLSVVFGVVEQHQGMVRVYSEPGQGTCFKVYLPTVERAATAVGGTTERPVEGGSERVLLVEDDERVRRVVHKMLAQAGYDVALAEDGAAALDRIEGGESFDLVVTDVVMPNVDGATLWRELRERFAKVRVLIMSGYAADSLLSRFPDDEEVVILSKPFRSSELLRRVRDVLDRPPVGS